MASNFAPELIFLLFKAGDAMLEPTLKLFLYESVQQSGENDATAQERGATYMLLHKIVINLPALVLGLVCGAWSDKVGRKLPMMLPCVGAVLGALAYIGSEMFYPHILPLVLVGAAVRGLLGKSAVISMALHSYITDTTSTVSRTTRLARLLSMNYFGYFFGSLLAGILLDVVRFNIVFSIVGLINAITCLIIVFCLEETSELGIANSDLFSIQNMKESFSVLTKERSQRFLLLSFISLVTLWQVCKAGEVDVTLLVVERKPLNWRHALYGYLLAADYACLGLGVLCLLPILSKRMHDVSLVLIGIFFKFGRVICIAVGGSSYVMFASVVVGAPASMVVSGSKSIVSKLVQYDEVGKIFSLMSTGETVSNLIGAVIFTTVYKITLPIWPPTVFVIEAVFFSLLFLVILCQASHIKQCTPNEDETCNESKRDKTPLIPNIKHTPPTPEKFSDPTYSSTVEKHVSFSDCLIEKKHTVRFN
ncbi:unnamed protein product [Dimorphilus gyrociliatus]|uniref:Uncharacterized protein n=1 Tax=Dimorphilus gyrociliatus TaxID=2664684 RepID=A0A7I8VY76_9ANNE|nr:unnamed protein product [Dimorphilus gyrociliatus]